MNQMQLIVCGIMMNYDIIIMHWTPWFCVSCQQGQQFMKDFLDSITVPYSTTWCMVCWTYIYGSTILCNLEANNGSKRRGLNPLDGRWICPFFFLVFLLRLDFETFMGQFLLESNSRFTLKCCTYGIFRHVYLCKVHGGTWSKSQMLNPILGQNESRFVFTQSNDWCFLKPNTGWNPWIMLER